MCLSVPAKLISITTQPDQPENPEPLNRKGQVSFGGVIKEISLAFVPEAHVGDYVLVHVGFGISVIDEDEAQFIFNYIKQTNENLSLDPVDQNNRNDL